MHLKSLLLTRIIEFPLFLLHLTSRTLHIFYFERERESGARHLDFSILGESGAIQFNFSIVGEMPSYRTRLFEREREIGAELKKRYEKLKRYSRQFSNAASTIESGERDSRLRSF